MKINVLYFEGCPNHRPAVELVEAVAAELNTKAEISEVPVEDAAAAERLRFFGSPSIQIDGVDIDPAKKGRSDYAFSCRIYGQTGLPPRQMLVDAMLCHAGAAGLKSVGGKGRVLAALAAMSAVVVGMLPSVTCPACWPVYAGLLSALGLGFLIESRYLMLAVGVLLTLSLISLAISGRTRRGYGPFLLGCAGGLLLLLGKFVLTLDVFVYGGVGLLLAASFWNAWPLPKKKAEACGSCRPAKVNVSIETGP